MILYYSIPHKLEEIIPFEENERIYYAVPFDIDDKGNWIKDSYLVVTTKKIHVYDGEKITNTIEINKCSKAKAEAKVGGGILVVTTEGEDTVVVHYSARHLSRYAYIA